MYSSVAYGKRTGLAAAVAAETVKPGALVVGSDDGRLYFVNADKTIVDLFKVDLDLLAPKANPTFTGVVTLPAADPTADTQATTKAYVDKVAAEVAASAIAPGVVSGTQPLPASHKAGQMFRVAAAGTYAGYTCEQGDLILCVADGETVAGADFIVLQANIDGAVTGCASSTDSNIAVFNGATGKVIKDSGITLESLNDTISKTHVHENKDVIDSYSSTQAELVTALEATMDEKIEENNGDYLTEEEVTAAIEAAVAPKANSADVYTKEEADAEIAAAVAPKANAADVYTKEQADAAISAAVAPKANAADVYAKTETYTQDEVDAAIEAAGADLTAEIAKKANQATTYTKDETDAAIEAAVAPKANSADVYAKTETYTQDEVDAAIEAAVAPKANSADVYTKTEADALYASNLKAAKDYADEQIQAAHLIVVF